MNGGGKKCDDPVGKCKTQPKLVRITVIRNATQTDVTGAKNWATVKKSTDDVIVQATTTPDTEDAWRQIAWSGDAGSPVPGHTNQRSLSRAASKKLHIEAALGGVNDNLNVWVLWGTVTVAHSGPRPANAVPYGGRYDGTEDLGAKEFDGGTHAVGKVVPVAQITPAGVHDVVKAGWAFRRHIQGEVWTDGTEYSDPRFFKSPAWVDDTSNSAFQNLTPDADDKIYDRDAPDITAWGTDDSEHYSNFEQWIEWHGEACSDNAQWYWRGRWQKSATPSQITLKEVDTGNPALPANSFFHPPAPPPSPGKSGRCFIATAAYGSPLAPEVRTLQQLRDDVLRRTRWGRRFFDEYWKHYYQFSPPLAAHMERDPEMKRVVRWSIVTPMLNYLKLLMARPAHWDLAGLDPEWQRFLAAMKRDIDDFLAAIELPQDLEGLSNDAAIDELNIAMDFVLKEPARIEQYLERLTDAGALPLKCGPGEKEALHARLRSAARSDSEIKRILHGI